MNGIAINMNQDAWNPINYLECLEMNSYGGFMRKPAAGVNKPFMIPSHIHSIVIVVFVL